MATPSYPVNLGQSRLLSAAGGGTALTTTRVHIAVGAGIKHAVLSTRNYTTAVVIKAQFNPFLAILKTIDGMATAPTDYSEEAQDGLAASVVSLSDMPTLANGGALYLGADERFSGLQIDVLAPDGGAAAMTVHYWNGTAWADISPTDNTSNLGSDGSVVWTVPTAWAKGFLSDILTKSFPKLGQELFWVRLTTATAYDASTTLSSVYSVNEYGDSGGMELASGQVFQTAIDRMKNGGNISALTDAGTANLIVNGFE